MMRHLSCMLILLISITFCLDSFSATVKIKTCVLSIAASLGTLHKDVNRIATISGIYFEKLA